MPLFRLTDILHSVAVVTLTLATTLCAQGPPQPPSAVRLVRDARDESAADLPAYRIETPAATYYLEKQGAGLSSLVDPDGQDWLSFHPRPESGAAGEYRGFPNAVHRQAGNYFHPLNAATEPSHTSVVKDTSEHVSILAESDNQLWQGRYDFYKDHATFTMTRMPAQYRYWILYEGTPGGQYDNSDWWQTSAIQDPQPMTVPHDKDIPYPEWIAFGDDDSKWTLLLIHHTDDEHPDRFYQMQNKMTVFGFGRAGIEKFLDTVPRTFSICLVRGRDHKTLDERARQLLGE